MASQAEAVSGDRHGKDGALPRGSQALALATLCTLLFLVVGDRSVRGTGDVEDVLGMQVIGTIDQFKTKIRRGKSAS